MRGVQVAGVTRAVRGRDLETPACFPMEDVLKPAAVTPQPLLSSEKFSPHSHGFQLIREKKGEQ